jgi:hypothetical protein
MNRKHTIDVRISTHNSEKNGLIVIVRFYNQLWELLDTPYIRFRVIADKLFFVPSNTKGRGALKITDNGTVTASKLADKLKSFEGEYKNLRYDGETATYYIDKAEATSIDRTYGNFTVPHPRVSHKKPEVKEKYFNDIPKIEPQDIDVSVKSQPTSLLTAFFNENMMKGIFDFYAYLQGDNSAKELLAELHKKY